MNGISERIEHFATAFWGAVGVGVAGLLFKFVRKIFTDGARITALETRLDLQEKHRRERDAAYLELMSDMKDGITEVRHDVKLLFQRGDT